jgi:hypothetical protein
MNGAFMESTRTDPALLGHVRDARNHAVWDKFVAGCSLLRGTSKQLIVDSFTMSHRPASSIPSTGFPAGVGLKPHGEPNIIRERLQPASVDLGLIVSRQVGAQHFVAVAETHSQPLPLRLDQLHSLVKCKDGDAPASLPDFAACDMKRVPPSVQKLRPEDWHAVMLELDHTA